MKTLLLILLLTNASFAIEQYECNEDEIIMCYPEDPDIEDCECMTQEDELDILESRINHVKNSDLVY